MSVQEAILNLKDLTNQIYIIVLEIGRERRLCSTEEELIGYAKLTTIDLVKEKLRDEGYSERDISMHFGRAVSLDDLAE